MSLSPIGSPTRIVAVLSAVSVRRYVPGIVRYNRANTSVWQLDPRHDTKQLLSMLDEWKPAGMILEHMPGITDALVDLDIPKVTVHYDFDDRNDLGWVDVNDHQVGQLAANFFSDKRLRHFGFFGVESQWSDQRLKGFQDALSAAKLELSTFIDRRPGHDRYNDYWPAPTPELLKWLKELPKPCGILAAHDPLGRALIEACAGAGIDVPRDIAVLGVNDDPLVCSLSQPQLSSIRVPWQRLGYELMGILDKMLEGQPAEHRVISPGTIGERFSTDVLAVENPLVARALELIREQISEGVNVAQVTEKLGCSRRHLERLFREHLGRSPKDEITSRQLAIARDLLLNTNLKVAAIAGEAGFHSVERFYAMFRRMEDMSPGAFRRQGGRPAKSENSPGPS
ncbi:substrate-binding domain-containing protein [Haloferula sp.]|uniref:substrate-binding domain-containing protein n=1 Tax=Haloferula sp. TaxID=2497595 RepID=UPI00329E2A5B